MRPTTGQWASWSMRLATTGVLLTIVLTPLIAIAQQSGTLEAEIGNQFVEAAQGAGAGQGEGEIEVVVARIIRVSLSLLGIIMVALLVYGGYLWMTAGGNEEQITKAKQIIRNAIIGIAIVLSAYAISVFVIRKLLQSTGNVQTPLG